MARYTTDRAVPILKAFDYFSDLEKYPERYPKYCAKLDIIERKGSTIITEEMWNMTLGMDISHVKVKVRYTLHPPNEIEYEILDESKAGTKNRIFLEERKDSTFMSISMVPLEIVEFSYGLTSEIFHEMQLYFANRDSKHLEGRSIGYEYGDPCPHCKKGKLSLGKKFKKETAQYVTEDYTKMICDVCDKSVNCFGRGIHN
ncbi:MAG: hypothetical protein EPO62_00390 [Candidatus Nitrosotenuis sp.]|nr:MAG: hypothetical protein EPO62_00390 [Candidatus Nitrosotenuis sp.]